MSLVRDIMRDSSSIVQSVLGEPCIFENKDGFQRNINVIIDRNIEVHNEYGLLAGYRVEAALLRDEVEDLLIGCHLTDELNVRYRIDSLQKETLSKYYVSLVVEDA